MATSKSTTTRQKRFVIYLERRNRDGRINGEHPLTGELRRGTAMEELYHWRGLYPAAKLRTV